MYTILVTDDNKLIISVKERIMQRSKLVDSFQILFNKTYKDINMTGFTAYIEYLLPVSKSYKTELLTVTECEDKEDYFKCTLPFDTAFTSEAGNIEMQVTFIKTELDIDGVETGRQFIRKTSTCNITIIPIAAWSDIIPDSTITAIDQKIVQLTALANELNDLADNLDMTKADNMIINDDGDLQLTAKGELIGNAISVAQPSVTDDDEDDNEGIIDLNKKYENVTI